MHMPAKETIGGLAARAGSPFMTPGTPANKLARRQVDYARHHLRHAAGKLDGLSYRLAGRHPDPEIPDNVLADRIRSELGGLEKRRDLPHIHVMVERHVALLHGDVATEDDAEAIRQAVAAVPGVDGINSHLHIGLLKSDTRPSEGQG
jgi:hypothetical protein